MRLSASRSALRPALTARPTMLERLDVLFLVAMHYLHQKARRDGSRTALEWARL
jgi:hypothetical protein